MLVAIDAFLFDRLLLRAGFRSFKKYNGANYVEYIKWELLDSSLTGHLIPYQSIEVDRLRRGAWASRYVPIPSLWKQVECYLVTSVDLPLNVTYLYSTLISDPNYGLWVLVLTEWMKNVATLLLWYFHGTFSL